MRIEDYGLLGDLQTAALVSRAGSIDWLCFPRFDSGACFAALLGTPEHGRWLLAPRDEAREVTRRYRPTRWCWRRPASGRGRGRASSTSCRRAEGNPDIVRIVEGVRGEVARRDRAGDPLRLRLGVPWVRRIDGALLAIAGPNALRLDTPAETAWRGHEDGRRDERVARATGSRSCSPGSPPTVRRPSRWTPGAALEETESFWGEWAGQCAYEGEWAEPVRSSIRVLKALTYDPTGGIVAAATTSLPEWIGSVRNWDYRYCWLRDATLTLVALIESGYLEEARAWREWLFRAAAGDPADLQVMYGVAGERRLDEFEADWLPGFEGSRPVRVGNAASEQLQLDVYGEIVDAFYTARLHGLEASDHAWQLSVNLLEFVEEAWRSPDSGIWEVRGEPRHFTHSKVMAWVAFDRMVRSGEGLGREGPVERWREIRDEIHADICRNGFDAELGAFVQSYGSKGSTRACF